MSTVAINKNKIQNWLNENRDLVERFKISVEFDEVILDEENSHVYSLILSDDDRINSKHVFSIDDQSHVDRLLLRYKLLLEFLIDLENEMTYELSTNVAMMILIVKDQEGRQFSIQFNNDLMMISTTVNDINLLNTFDFDENLKVIDSLKFVSTQVTK